MTERTDDETRGRGRIPGADEGDDGDVPSNPLTDWDDAEDADEEAPGALEATSDS